MKAKKTEQTNRQGVAVVMGMFEALGFAFREQTVRDCGIDGHAELIKAEHPTGQLLGIQIKTGISYLSERTEAAIVFRADAEHVEYWLTHSLPVIVCLCDIDNHAIYWEAVTKESAIPTGKGYRFDIPVTQLLDDTTVPKLKDLLTPFVAQERFTVFKTDDMSHGVAKRYCLRVVVNGKASKAEIASIIRQVTAEGAKRRYYRNHQVEGLWGDADAHVIWTFVYLSAEDESRFNHVCRSQWVHQSLAENARPSQMAGEHIGNDIVVDWNEHRLDLTQVRSANTLTKEAYLNRVSPLMGELKQLIEKLGCELLSLKNGDTTEETFLHSTEHDRQRINAIYTDVSSMSFAPFECIEMDKCLERLVASMDNVVLHYSETSRSRWTALDRIELALQQHSNATTDLGGLEYEFRKIR